MDEIVAYCNWLNEKHSNVGLFRLPYAHEWLSIAYGKDRSYPWGSIWVNDHVCIDKLTTERVKNRPAGCSPEGIYGLFGNVNELVLFDDTFRNRSVVGVGMVWMGGSFLDKKFSEKQNYWGFTHNSSSKMQSVGFRVIIDPFMNGKLFIPQTQDTK